MKYPLTTMLLSKRPPSGKMLTLQFVQRYNLGLPYNQLPILLPKRSKCNLVKYYQCSVLIG